MPPKITQRIKDFAFDLLQKNPDGLRYSELSAQILEQYTSLNSNTIAGTIWNLDETNPSKVYKPSRGVFRLLEYKPVETAETKEPQTPSAQPEKITEASFYPPFVDYLLHELEEVTRAIPVGGNIFKEKWGTPDVVGKRESRRTDIIKGETEIVSAEIKTDTAQLVTAF